MKSSFVIVDARGEFFSGDWSRISWTPEYPSARVYTVPSLARRELGKLQVEVWPCHRLPLKLVRDYGLDSECVVEGS